MRCLLSSTPQLGLIASLWRQTSSSIPVFGKCKQTKLCAQRLQNFGLKILAQWISWNEAAEHDTITHHNWKNFLIIVSIVICKLQWLMVFIVVQSFVGNYLLTLKMNYLVHFTCMEAFDARIFNWINRGDVDGYIN